MLEITPTLSIPETEFVWAYSRSGGPGGQNVNKVASKVELRWNLAVSTVLPEAVKARLMSQQKNRLTTEGEFLVTSQLTRDQDKNRRNCLDKLQEMVRRATVVPVPRVATRPSKGSNRRRLATKKRAATRRDTRKVSGDE